MDVSCELEIPPDARCTLKICMTQGAWKQFCEQLSCDNWPSYQVKESVGAALQRFSRLATPEQ
ncbi:MAG: hypothetical protein ACYS7Y_35275, partial [Planctomycetota bacterium]